MGDSFAAPSPGDASVDRLGGSPPAPFRGVPVPSSTDAAIDLYDPEYVLTDADPDSVRQSYRELYRAYRSMQHMISVYRRQLDTVRGQTIYGAQVADFARKLNVTELDRIGDAVMDDLPRITGARAGALYLYDRDRHELTLLRAAPMPNPVPAPMHPQRDGRRLCMYVLEHERSPFLLSGVTEYGRRVGMDFESTPGDEIFAEGALLCPLLIDAMGREPIPVGLLVLADKDNGFYRNDLEHAAMLSEMIAASLNTASLLRRMSVLAETDGLTGLYNHRHFQQELDRAVARVRRYGEPLSLALLDIDWFKSVNDTHGHQFGDQVLREVARTVKSSVRDVVDIVARYGGEEFAVVMPNTDLPGACLTTERIRENVQALEILNKGQRVTITVSCGVAAFTPKMEKSVLIDRADRMLYRAKHQGRNRVEAYDGEEGPRPC